MKIGVFCSANQQIAAEYFEQTAALGAWMAQQGHTLVFGGCNMGLMECVAKAVHDHGGRTIGVVPTKVEERGRVSDFVDVHIPCENLDDRKALMVMQSDVFVALPGGLGTLDEVFTVVAAATIGYHAKRVLPFNMGGFWNSLVAMLNDLAGKGVMRGDWQQRIVVADTLEAVIDALEASC